MTARKRSRKVAPTDLYGQHAKRVAREAGGFIAANGRGAWVDEMARRRDVAPSSEASGVVALAQLRERCPACGHMFTLTAGDVCETCQVTRERVQVADGLFGGMA